MIKTTLISIATSLVILGGFFAYQNYQPQSLGLPIMTAPQGGTGKGTATAGDVGKVLKVLSDSPFTYEFATDNTGVGGGSTDLVEWAKATSSLWRVANLISVGSSTLHKINSTYASTSQLTIGSDYLTDFSTGFSISGAGVVTLDTSGTWSGNAVTATGLAANGSNCSAGSAAGGVSATGVAEDCTDYWTEAENSAAAYISDGNTNWDNIYGFTTFAYPFSNFTSWFSTSTTFLNTAGFMSNASSTIGLLDSVRSTSTNFIATNATTSALRISSALSFAGVAGDAWADFCVSITGSATLCDGADGGGLQAVSTSSNEVAGQVPVFTTNSGSPALISGDTGFTFDTANNRLVVGDTTATPGALALYPGSGGNFIWQDNWTDTGEQNLRYSYGATPGVIPLMVLRQSGRLGIGTTTPGTKLSVNGPAVITEDVFARTFQATSTQTASTFTYASSTYANFNTASTSALVVSGLGGSGTRCLQIGSDGTVSVSSVACGTLTVDNNKWSTTTGSLVGITPNAASVVGIGTSTPRALLHLASSTAPQVSLSDGFAGTNSWSFRSIMGSLFFSTSSPDTFTTTTASSLNINANGNVGILTNNPTKRLTVGPGTNIQSASDGIALVLGGGRYILRDPGISNGEGYWGWNSTDLQFGTVNAIEPQRLSLAMGGTSRLTITAGGLVGVGTSSARFTFNVASSTAAQIGLSDGSATANPWYLRSISGGLYIGTSSPSTYATSSTFGLFFSENGFPTFGALQGSGTSCAQLDASGALTRTGGACGGSSVDNNKWATSSDSVSIQPNVGQGIIVLASSTLARYDAVIGTTTNATTTTEYVSGHLRANSLRVDSAASAVLSVTGTGVLQNTTVSSPLSFSGATLSCATCATFGYDFTPATSWNATSTIIRNTTGFIANASSSLAFLDVVIGTTTNATSTFAYVSSHFRAASIRNDAVTSSIVSATATGVQQNTTVSSPLAFSGSTLSCATCATFAYPYTTFTSWFSTSTIYLNTAGFMSNASSTFHILKSGYSSSTIYASFATASTSALIVSGLGGNGTRCLQTDSFGTVSANASACGSGSSVDYNKWATSTGSMLGINPLTAFFVGIGTSTPRSLLHLATSTAPQITISDGFASYDSWNFRTVGGTFFLATSSMATNATSSLSVLTIGSDGVVNFGNRINTCIALTGSSDLCDGVDSGGVGGTSAASKWATTTGNVLSIYPAGALRVGIGTTSPYAELSINTNNWPQLMLSDTNLTTGMKHWVASTTPLGRLVWGTINDAYTSITNVMSLSTSTVDYAGYRLGWAFGTSTEKAYYGLGTSTDQIWVDGRINTGDWHFSECAATGNRTAQVTTDLTGSVLSTTLGMPCPGWAFVEDANGVLDETVMNGYSYFRLRAGPIGTLNAAAGDGFGIQQTTSWMNFASNTPKLSAKFRLAAVENATTSLYMIGFGSMTGVSSDHAALPTYFAGVVSSTTEGNWIAVVKNGTQFIYKNTGIASSSVLRGESAWGQWDVEVSSTTMRVIYKGANGIATTTNQFPSDGSLGTYIPTHDGLRLTPIVSTGKPTMGLQQELHVGWVRLWWRDLIF